MVPAPLPPPGAPQPKPKGKVRHHRGGRKRGTRNVNLATMAPHRAAWNACQSTGERGELAARLGVTLSTLYHVAQKLGWPRGRRGYSLRGVPNTQGIKVPRPVGGPQGPSRRTERPASGRGTPHPKGAA